MCVLWYVMYNTYTYINIVCVYIYINVLIIHVLRERIVWSSEPLYRCLLCSTGLYRPAYVARLTHPSQSSGACYFTLPTTGWWYTYPSENYELVSWDDDIPNIWKNKNCSKPPTTYLSAFLFIYLPTCLSRPVPVDPKSMQDLHRFPQGSSFKIDPTAVPSIKNICTGCVFCDDHVGSRKVLLVVDEAHEKNHIVPICIRYP